MFRKSQNKPSPEIAAPVRVLAREPRDPRNSRKAEPRARPNSITLRSRSIEAAPAIRDLRVRISKAPSTTSPESTLGRALAEALARSQELRAAITEKATDVDKFTKRISAKLCEPLRKELEEVVLILAGRLHEAMEINVRAHDLCARLRELGGEPAEVFISRSCRWPRTRPLLTPSSLKLARTWISRFQNRTATISRFRSRHRIICDFTTI